MKERNWVFERLRVQESASSSLLLQNGALTCSVQAFEGDVLRIRIVPGGKFPKAASWSVTGQLNPTTAIIEKNSGQVRLETKHAALECNLNSGELVVRDSFGFEVFRFEPGELAFREGKARVAFSLAEQEKIFGLGETTGPWNKRGLVRELWNIDVLGHSPGIHPGLKGLYVTIPFVISLRHGRAAGLFWDNPAKQTWEIGQPDDHVCRVTADSGEIDLYLFMGPKLPDILRAYTTLTGRMKMPPLWGLGFHQSRYSYQTAKELQKVGVEFRERKIPCDALYLDIDYMDGYRVFTAGKKFGGIKPAFAKIKKLGFKLVPIIDPGVKVDRQFGVLNRGQKEKAFVRDAAGKKDFAGKVWPGKSLFPDFTNAAARSWWAKEQCAFQKRHGFDGFWNDMNEPANFAAANKTLDLRAVHRTDFGIKRHAEVHNVYGLQMAKASEEGALQCEPNKRPFIITRAGYAGIQRHALVWTGDTTTSWDHLGDSIQMLLNLTLSGVAFCGADVGGFLGHCTGELLARWTQMAAFTPFFRNHSDKNTRAQEPWQFGVEVEGICRKYIELRYQLLPYLYSLFAEAARDGSPIMRPLIWHYQNDEQAARVGDEFMVGPFMLVAPITQQGGSARSVYLPRGRWYSFWTGQEFSGGQHSLVVCDLQTMPLFIRAGSIIPFQPVQQFAGEKAVDTMTLHVWPGRSGEFTWYEDDVVSNEYLKGAFSRRTLLYSEKKRAATLEFNEPEGTFKTRIKSWRVVVHTKRGVRRVHLETAELPSQFVEELGLFIFDVPNFAEAFKVIWR